MSTDITRRQWLGAATALTGASLPALATTLPGSSPTSPRPLTTKPPFGYMLNTATIMGQKLSLVEQIEIAAKAGYDAIEPWLRDIEAHVSSGKSLEDAAKLVADRGLKVESAIGFAPWIVEDEAARKKGLEQAKRDMELVRRLGGTRMAAPPVGATDRADLSLLKIADRYARLCELGETMGVTAQVEIWGHSKSLSRLGEAALVAVESAHPRACILADVYHLYKGGSGFAGLKLMGGSSMQVFHMNDYPANPPRDKIRDEHRVYPGDGIAPLSAMLRDLVALGFRGMLSLELFNRDYWKQDALVVSRTGLEKMKAVVARAMAG